MKLGEPDISKDETELQFLVKWKNWSHLHSTWEAKEGLVAQNVKKMQEIERWFVSTFFI